MNCREAQRELALHAGEDLGDPQREADVQQHLAQCPACRRRHSGVKTALAALAVTDSSSTFDSVHSLWPAVRRRIAQGEDAALGPNWQSTTSVVAGLAVCAGLMVSTAMLLRRPVVPEPGATSPGFSMQYDDRAAAYPAGGVVRPVSTKKPAEKVTPQGGLMRKISLPEE
jgi:anti-sigma factor RsiW